MSSIDNISLAYKKNRVGKTRLETELNRINREQLIEMRMHNNAKQRFKNKYAKLDVFDESKGSEPSDVVMYETHNPGFCYRRNGECRLQQSNIKSTSVDMQDLHMLLFTNGEIDIEKVLCLYLLTAHKTDTLSLPPKSQKISFLARQQSPLERLVDRSKKRTFESKLLETLPLYSIEIRNGKREPIKDQRLASRIIINVKILQIVSSVQQALESSNPETISKFRMIVKNKELIKDVFNKPKIHGFIRNLYGQNIISSCESFHLVPLTKEIIKDFELNSEPLDNLVSIIRNNVLQMPTANSWKMFYKSPSTTSTSSECTLFENQNSKDTDSRIMSYPQLVSYPRPSDEPEEFSLDYDETVDLESCCSFVYEEFKMVQPKILKNLQLGFSNMKEDDAEVTSQKLDIMDFDKLADLLSEKVKKEANKDYKHIMSMAIKIPEIESETILQTSPGKFTLKQTTCQACMNKWKTPLPSPKTSKIKKMQIPVLKESVLCFTSRSAQRVSEMIDEEVKKFEVSSKSSKAEAAPMSNRIYKKMAKGNIVDGNSIEIIDLDDLELAKIRQEIKVHETEKKLEAFMNKINK